MNDNMALMSQSEIDTLVEFLTMQKSQVANEVLDQNSIDRLIQLLQTDVLRELKYDTAIPENRSGENSALLLIDDIGDLREQQENCLLEITPVTKDGYVEVVCRHKKTNKKYKVTPKCVEHVRFFSSDFSVWGYAIPPITFDSIAALLSVKYTKATFESICSTFAKRMYGDEAADIPAIYMPTTSQLIHHITDEKD